MTIVEIIDHFNGFSTIKGFIRTNKKSKLLWIVCILAFILSAIIDNLTATIVLITILRKLISDKKLRIWYAGMIIIAANAGGAWSPIGDVTTTMLWMNEKVTTVKLIWDSEVRSFRLDSDIEFNFDYYPSSVESLVSGYPKGFYDYKEIEWLTINTSASNLKLIDDSLSEIGQFCVNKSTSSIQVFAYKNT